MSARNGKPCPKCNGEKWYKNGKCAKCHKERDRKWRESNPGKGQAASLSWYHQNKARSHANKRRRRKNNSTNGVDNASSRKRYSLNPEKGLESNRRWRRANPEKAAAQTNRRRTRKTEAGGSYAAEEWKALCEQYDNCCACCGKKKKLEFDHVIPVSKGGSSDISNGQPLCRSCNASKGDKTIDYRDRKS